MSELRRYRELSLLLAAGEIAEMEVHPAYELAPGVTLDGRRRHPLRYTADYGACVEPAGGGVRVESMTRRARLWITGRDTGVSSRTIWAVMMGAVNENAGLFDYGVPHDPDDFGRCKRLLDLVPEWRARLGEVATRFPEWAGLVREWERVEALYLEELPSRRAPRCYDLMQTLLREEG